MRLQDWKIKQLCTSNSHPQCDDAHVESDLLEECFFVKVLDSIMDAKEQPIKSC